MAYDALFIGGGPMDDKTLHIPHPHDHEFYVYKPGFANWAIIEHRENPPMPQPVRGVYKTWAVDHKRMRIVYAWAGWENPLQKLQENQGD